MRFPPGMFPNVSGPAGPQPQQQNFPPGMPGFRHPASSVAPPGPGASSQAVSMPTTTPANAPATGLGGDDHLDELLGLYWLHLYE